MSHPFSPEIYNKLLDVTNKTTEYHNKDDSIGWIIFKIIIALGIIASIVILFFQVYINNADEITALGSNTTKNFKAADAAINTRIDTSDARLTSVDARLTSADARLTSADALLATQFSEADARLATQFAAADAQLATVDTQFRTQLGEIPNKYVPLVDLNTHIGNAVNENINIRLPMLEKIEKAIRDINTTDIIDTRLATLDATINSKVSDAINSRIDTVINSRIDLGINSKAVNLTNQLNSKINSSLINTNTGVIFTPFTLTY